MPAGLVSFYVVQSGGCQFLLPDTEPIHCRAGDFVLATHGTAHRLCDRVDSPVMPLTEISRRWPGPQRAPRATTIVYGHCRIGPPGRSVLQDNLPPVLCMNGQSHPRLLASGPMLATIMKETNSRHPGWHSIVQRLVQLLFVETFRAYFTSAAGEPNGTGSSSVGHWRAVNDPVIGISVRMMHADPGRPWTVPHLARQTGISKSAFSERFREIVGQSPLQYLTEFRMQKACELLAGCDQNIKQIASLVGYESASSFTNTFKRWVGSTPAEYRKTLDRNGDGTPYSTSSDD